MEDQPKKKTRILVVTGLVVLILSGIGAYFLLRPQVQPGTYYEVDFSGFERTVANGKTYYLDLGDGMSHKIMDLNGSYYEMGYAHGELVGNYIKYSVSYAFNTLFGGDLAAYDSFTKETGEFYILDYAVFNETYHLEELNGILDASVESDHDMFVPELNRNWTLIDLMILNVIQDINQDLGSEFCSGFGIWGDASSDGDIIIARTLDFPTDPSALISQLSLIVIYQGDSSIQNKIVTFTYPGIIGAISGFNDKGVWISTDNSNGLKTIEPGRTPMGIAMRNFLEQAEGGENTLEDARSFFLKESPYMPFLFLVGGNITNGVPVAVLEGNDAEVIIRRGSDEDFENYVFLTNHQRILTDPVPCNRWDLYVNNFEHYLTTGDNKIDWQESIQMIREGGGTPSIQTILFRPASLEFAFASNYVENAENGVVWNYNQLRGAGRNPTINVTISFTMLA